MTTVKLLRQDQFDNFLSECAIDVDLATNPETENPYSCELDDAYSLYRMTRETAAVSILEFGSGWSTLAFALAISENKRAMGEMYQVRHPNPFKVMTVDASAEWIATTLRRIPTSLQEFVFAKVATPRLLEYQGQFVSFFDDLPYFVPDIVYVDGPDPEQVVGMIDGFSSTALHGLPMSADVLRLEPHLWPWTIVITDGRRANARLLEVNLRRNWQVLHDPFGDQTMLRLDETPFGPVSEMHLAARLTAARALRQKGGPVQN